MAVSERTRRRRPIQWRGHSLGKPYMVIVFFLGANWLWDIWDRVIK